MYSVSCLILFLHQVLYLVAGLRALFVPIKNKGDANNPDNYRGITVLSCFGKLFYICT